MTAAPPDLLEAIVAATRARVDAAIATEPRAHLSLTAFRRHTGGRDAIRG